MNQPVDHIARAILPWRHAERGMTECGLAASSYPTIGRDAYFKRVRDLGKTRATMLTCVTCSERVCHYAPWEHDPVSAMARETNGYWIGYCGDVGDPMNLPPRPSHDTLRRELLAIAALIARHREEFDAHLASLGEGSELAAARRRRAAKGKRPRADIGLRL